MLPGKWNAELKTMRCVVTVYTVGFTNPTLVGFNLPYLQIRQLGENVIWAALLILIKLPM